MGRLLITIGKDGATNWVKTPDGRRLNLGALSVLTFVTKLALGGGRETKRALKSFLQGTEVMLLVDEERMWTMFTPRRSRLAADSFMSQVLRRGSPTMATNITTDLAALERHVQMLNKAAGKVPAEKMAEGVAILVKLASKTAQDQEQEEQGQKQEAQEQAKQAAQEEKKDEDKEESKDEDKEEAFPGAAPPFGSKDKKASLVLSFDVYKANTDLAEGILDRMSATDQKIDQLVAAGKKFDVVQAKSDLHAVTSKVASIVSEVDLTTPWVGADLQKLAAKAEHLHGLFFPKK
jgi:hypothetical protein